MTKGRAIDLRSATVEYVPLNFCAGCGRDFTGVGYFDRHRVGKHAYDFAEGIQMDPPREDGRRCLDDSELLARGLRPMTEAEMRDSRYAGRIGSGVALWFNPAEAVRPRKNPPRSAAEGLREAA